MVVTSCCSAENVDTPASHCSTVGGRLDDDLPAAAALAEVLPRAEPTPPHMPQVRIHRQARNRRPQPRAVRVQQEGLGGGGDCLAACCRAWKLKLPRRLGDGRGGAAAAGWNRVGSQRHCHVYAQHAQHLSRQPHMPQVVQRLAWRRRFS